ncbi:retrovirus-related pol polyprotein from transposon TNT 1-94, partial [Tanacetum coccineum]
WRPTGQTFTIVGNTCPLTRITTTTEVPLRKSSTLDNKTPKHVITLVYSRKPRKSKTSVPINNYMVIKSVTDNNSEPSQSPGSIVSNVPYSSLDECSSPTSSANSWVQSNSVMIMLQRLWVMETIRLGMLQFCDSNLEVPFRQHTCYIRNLEGVDLLTGSRGDNMYTLSLGDMMASSPIYLLSKASKTKSWLWHRKSTKKPHKPKTKDTNQEKIYLLHMDLCGPMRVASVNRKKYNLVIVNDYSRFTWVKCLRSKDEAPAFIGSSHLCETLREYYEKVGISHETSVAHSPQQNGVVERQNRTLIEAARTMLIYAKAPLFLWAEAVASLKHAGSVQQTYSGIVETILVKLCELTCIAASETRSLGRTSEMDLQQSVSGLVQTSPLTPFVPPSRTDWDMLFQPLFDEFLNPSPSVDHPAPEVVVPINIVIAPVLAGPTVFPQ